MSYNAAAQARSAHKYYLKNRAAYARRAKAWVAANPQRAKEIVAAWDKLHPDRALARAAKYRQLHPEKAKAATAAWRADNQAKLTANQARYRAAKLKATPPWLTKQHWEAIEAIYVEAARRQGADGLKRHVDHIYPLQGTQVCGLHVPWNLQILLAFDNQSKHNK